MEFRFRNEGELVVLQVFEPPQVSSYSYERHGKWRDAKTEDLLDVARTLLRQGWQERVDIGGSVDLRA